MNSWTHVVGWTLIHFAWQGIVLGALAAAILRVCGHRSANVRYVVACVALMAMLASAVITARVLVKSDVAFAPTVTELRAYASPEVLSLLPGSRTHEGVSVGRGAWGHVDALLPVIVFVWLAGVVVLLARMVAGMWHVHRLQVKALAARASRWQTATARIVSRLGVRATVHVVESAQVDTPTALGWLRPVILLPIAALGNLSPSQVEAILAHELIHIRRHDFVINIVQTLAETLLFYHPAVWWISRQIRAEREHCCDDVAVQVCGDPVEYAAALAELEVWRSREVALAVAATNGSLVGRVRRVLNAPVGHDARSLNWVVPVGLTLVLLIPGVYVLSAAPSAGGPVLADDAGQVVEPVASPDSFEWQVFRTDHFDIHYYPALAPNVRQAADSAEGAYQSISSDLRYDLPFRVPLILFKTRSDFQQQTIVPEAKDAIIQGQVTAFTEPKRMRVVILIEEDPDLLDHRITHELTHVFAFDLIPRSLATNAGRVPVWIDEGLAEYMTGVWDPANLGRIRDLVSAGNVPRMTALTGGEDDRTRRSAADLGHAAFDFIEAEYGKPAIWQFLNGVRRNVIDGRGDLYQTAFNRTAEEFDSAFEQYLRRRFGL